MTRLRIFLYRLGALLRSRQVDRDIEDEIASHLAEATDEYIRQGLSPEDARRVIAVSARRSASTTAPFRIHPSAIRAPGTRNLEALIVDNVQRDPALLVLAEVGRITRRARPHLRQLVARTLTIH